MAKQETAMLQNQLFITKTGSNEVQYVLVECLILEILAKPWNYYFPILKLCNCKKCTTVSVIIKMLENLKTKVHIAKENGLLFVWSRISIKNIRA